jgi:hypothetical protein
MTDKYIKKFIEFFVRDVTGHTLRSRYITEDDTPIVAWSIAPDDNSNGVLELRYVACTNDTTITGISGTLRVPYTKMGGYVTLGTVAIVDNESGSGVMASSGFTLAANVGAIEGTATGATGQQAAWEFISLNNSAQAPILP